MLLLRSHHHRLLHHATRLLARRAAAQLPRAAAWFQHPLRMSASSSSNASASSPAPSPPAPPAVPKSKIRFCPACGSLTKLAVPDGDEKMRAVCSSCGRVHYENPKMVVGCLVEHDNKVLLCRRKIEPAYGLCFSFVSGIAGTSLFNSVSLMAYNVFYTSIPVLTTVLDKDFSEKTVMQNPEILLYCQAGRLLNPSTFAGWFGRSLYHAIVVFLITIHAYENEKSEMEELSMVALSGSIWLQAFVMTLEMNIPSAGMYTIMFRLCRQPSYWVTLLLITGVGMGPVLALKYFRYTYRPSAINILQKAERSCGPMYTLANLESQLRSENDNATNSILTTPVKNKSSVYEPLLSDFPLASRRSLATSSFDIFQPAQSRVPASYPRNIKTN